MFLGIDLGSTTTKAIIVDGHGVIKASHLIASGNDFRRSGNSILTDVMQKAGLTLSEVKNVVTTGYGRYISGIESKIVSEITCCGRGASHLHPATRTIIDIGGQDSKCIKINPKGKVIDFALNDKCAAGTGRFLERIATSLGMQIKDMAQMSMSSQEKVAISSMCTVFAETEVISRISSGEPLDSIVKGLHYALATRISTLITRLRPEKDIFMCGGGAMNEGLVKELTGMLGPIKVPEGIDPRLVVALGAAMIASDKDISEAI